MIQSDIHQSTQLPSSVKLSSHILKEIITGESIISWLQTHHGKSASGEAGAGPGICSKSLLKRESLQVTD